MIDRQNKFDREPMVFSTVNVPTETTGAYQNERQFILSMFQMKAAYDSLSDGDFANGHQIKLIDVYPLNFPIDQGGPDEKRAKKISGGEILCYYYSIDLPQMK